MSPFGVSCCCAALLAGVAAAEPEFKVFQFPHNQIPRIDGDASDWAMVPASYAIGSDRLKDTLRNTPNDPATLDVRVTVGWVKGLDRLYFLYEAYDDYWDFAMPGMHNDIFEVMVDGDASGGPIGPSAVPSLDQDSWEGHLMHGVQAQNYHVFTPSEGKNWAMVWGCQPWALEFPWSNAAESYAFTHGESGRYTLEFWITPFDHAPFDGPGNAVVSRLEENKAVGLAWVVLDYDDENARMNGYRSFNNLARETGVHSNADFLRPFTLMPLESPPLQARWSFKILDLEKRTVAFTDESLGAASAWHWDFGDGATSSERHPVHAYEKGGLNYVVSLRVEGPAGSDAFARVWELCLP